jgi:plasmid stabilization system protein ParE
VRVVWSPLAIDRAGEAAANIAREKPGAAAKWVGELFFAAVGTLGRMPKRRRRVPETDRPELRELLFGSYRVIYRIEPKRVSILTVRHARRLLDLAELGEAP